MPRNLLTAPQVATRLGVKLPTVYAYVSRGVLSRSLAPDGRASRFDAAEVDRLARRGRPRAGGGRIGAIEVSVATSITCIRDDRLYYRGHDATALAARETFEAVAELLWTGELGRPGPWDELVTPATLEAARPTSRVARPTPRAVARPTSTEVAGPTPRIPAGASPIEQIAVATALLACASPLRVDLRPARVLEHARGLLAALVDSVRLRGVASPARGVASSARGVDSTRARGARPARLAARLWPRLSPLPATAARVAVLDAALVLLADHELATSTLAARVAASTRADPFAVVLAGLGAMSGPLHGKAALAAHQLVEAARRAPAVEALVARALAGGRLPGFGHPVYRGVDPRARHLLDRLADLLPRAERAVIDDVLAAASSLSDQPVTVDFALGALASCLHMPPGATEAIFAVARVAGWIAHALEEYGEEPLRFRARAIYVGPPPRSTGR